MKKLIFMLAAISVSATLWGQAITDQSFLDGRRTFEPLGTIAQSPGSAGVNASPTSGSTNAAQVGQALDNHRDPALAGKVSDVEDQGINLNDNTNAGILSRLSFLEYLHGLKSATPGPSQPSTGFIPQQAGDDQVIIIGYRGTQKKDLVIPVRSEDGGVKGTVIGIGPGALANMRLEGKLTFEEGTQVATIAEEAFANNNLVEVSIPNTVTTIESGAFSNNRLTSVDIPSSITELADSIFANNQLQGVNIPNTITLIKHHAFSNNKLSGTLQIPSSVAEIDNSAFENNYIGALNLPTTITTILDSAFARNELTTLDISKLDQLTVLNYGIFSHNKLTKITLHPTAITEIGDSAFSDNQLPEVTIPISVTTIGKGAFSVNKLTKVLFVGDTTKQATTSLGEIEGSSLTYIGPGAFAYNRLPQISIPNSVTEIASQAFADNQLDRIALGKVVIVGAGAFQYNNLKTVTIPNTIKRIGDSAFIGPIARDPHQNQNKLEQVTLGENVEFIGPRAFAYNSLTQLAVPNSVNTIGASAFEGNPINALVLGRGNKGVKMEIQQRAFYGVKIDSLVLPDISYDPSSKTGGLYLGKEAFAGNNLLPKQPQNQNQQTPGRGIIIPKSTNPLPDNASIQAQNDRLRNIQEVFDTGTYLIYL